MTSVSNDDSALRVIGCGDAFCSGGRYQTCFKLNFRGQIIILDFGPSALAPLRQALPNLDQVDQVVISHLHGDHFGGLPFFLLDAQFASRRKRPLTIAGPKGIQKRIQDAINIFFPSMGTIAWRFPLSFVEFEPCTERIFDMVSIRAYEVDHPDPSPALAIRMEFENKILGFSGDTGWTEQLIHVARDADLFVCECYSYEPNHLQHLDWQTLQARESLLKAKRILLTHMSQAMLDRVPHLDQGRFEFAVDGLSVNY